MSEYQYYEFQAVDRLLDDEARAKLRAISSRAHITASSFVNSYDWGDLKADPLQLLEKHFDLFLYFANWGTRWFAMKLPSQALDIDALQSYELDEDLFALRPAGEHMILSICRNELDIEDWEEDGRGWLASLAPLRTELLAGDLRLFSLLWLIQVENGCVDEDVAAPAPGLAPLSPALAALAEFLCLDGDLLEAAAGSGGAQAPADPAPGEVESFIRGLPEDEKVTLLLRLHAGEAAHASAELRRRSRAAAVPPSLPAIPRPTAGELQAAARRINEERKRRADKKAAAERRRQDQEAARAQAKRVEVLARRGEQAWRELETLIALRNPSGYDHAKALLVDLGALAEKNRTRDDFARRIGELRARHASKRKFIERLNVAGLPAPDLISQLGAGYDGARKP